MYLFIFVYEITLETIPLNNIFKAVRLKFLAY